MKKIIQKAATLIEALPYIQEFRDAIIVVKLGGSAMEDPDHMRSILRDVTFMECVGMRAVIVHGGGKAISRGMKRKGIAPNFVEGLRVTCARTIKVVEQVFADEVNPGIVDVLSEMGAKARGLKGEKVLRVKKMQGVKSRTGEKLSWGYVGEPTEVSVRPIRALLSRRVIPVITPLGLGPRDKVHNVNADVAAAAIAKALKARKLAFVSDVPGLLRDADDEKSVMATLNCGEVESLMEKGVISGGMLPKVSSGVEALHAGVNKIHMIDGRMPHSLLLEIFTDKGVGTEIVREG